MSNVLEYEVDYDRVQACIQNCLIVTIFNSNEMISTLFFSFKVNEFFEKPEDKIFCSINRKGYYI